MESEKVKEIKQALECCKYRLCEVCQRLKQEPNQEEDCRLALIEQTLTLINELGKENKELKQHITEVEKGIINIAREINKKEELASKFIDSYNDSLKQFAERLKVKTRVIVDFYKDHADKSFNGISEKGIDETLEEFLK